MSYSYECNVICDLCASKVCSGEPMETPEEAKESAISDAVTSNWFNEYGSFWVCSDCLKKIIAPLRKKANP